jgi:hypothetical protein
VAFDNTGNVKDIYAVGENGYLYRRYWSHDSYFTYWGMQNVGRVRTLTKVEGDNYLWQDQYFDGLGRVVQTQSRGVNGVVVIDSTVSYSDRGLVDKAYVSQEIPGSQVGGYKAPEPGWEVRFLRL